MCDVLKDMLAYLQSFLEVVQTRVMGLGDQASEFVQKLVKRLPRVGRLVDRYQKAEKEYCKRNRKCRKLEVLH